jgi:Uma2 family endonuclease
MQDSLKRINIPTTLEEFLTWEAPVDGYKYEWNGGTIIQFEKMNKKHLRLIRLLIQKFYATTAFQEGGALIAEQDVLLTGIQLRRPDLAFFSGAQIDNSGDAAEPIPAFVIEVISPNDDAEKVEFKRLEYFRAGVQLIWHIYLEAQIVYVYSGAKTVHIAMENDVCSAAPVLPDFAIEVKQLFA